MVWDEERNRSGRIAGTVVLLILLALLGGILYLRFFATDSVKLVTEQTEPAAQEVTLADPETNPAEESPAEAAETAEEITAPAEEAQQPEEAPEAAELPAEETEAAEENQEGAEEAAGQPEESAETPAEEAAVEPVTTEYTPIHYDERSFGLVTDMVFAYKTQPANMDAIIAADVSALKEHDPRLGEAWGTIMDYWSYANNELEVQMGQLPDDLPDDDSLCIVVLGYKLKRDGSMAKAMTKRCDLALAAAQQYPNAYILLCGGCTATRSPETSEASVMAEWFKEQGISEDRLILEKESLTTDQNAAFSLHILANDYPQIKHLVIVSADYHLPLSALLFTAASTMRGAEYGQPPFDVVACLGYEGKASAEFTEPDGQGKYLWTLLHPGT